MADMEGEESASALAQFRRQWQEEVNARTKRAVKRNSQDLAEASSKRPDGPKSEGSFRKPPTRHLAAEINADNDDDEEQADGETSSMIQQIEGLKAKDVDEDEFSVRGAVREPQSALEHYERAVEKESQGNLGESLSHYRRAYRLDARVDQSYKNKHFPARSKPSNANPSNSSVTPPSTAHHSSKDPAGPLATPELVKSFADCSILGAEPLIEGDKPPPCPIKDLPHEVILEILLRTAVIDPASFVRLSLVCKKLAYYVNTENAIWKRVAIGPEFGLSSQLYSFSTDVQGREAIQQTLEDDGVPLKIDENYFSSDADWREIFHSHPRIRFTGVYISTVNYTRAGGASAFQATWNSPVHIVTYYRYLRFFRNGTVISLLTTNEPIEVVHHLTRENLSLVRTGDKQAHPLNFTSSAPALTGAQRDGVALPPTAQQLMKHALRGRWRICHPSESSEPEQEQATSELAASSPGLAGDVHIETEGAGPRYMYVMHLSLKSGSRSKHATKNNKLHWKGFWSYNQLTNDWAEFTLRNDRAFYFSRVKSYGLGY